MNIILDRRFFASGAALGARADRVMAFVEKVLADASRGGVALERIDKAADAKFCSLRVDGELRAIGLEAGNDLVLLYVGHHEDAYRWARTHRTLHEAHGLSVVDIPDAATSEESPCALAGTCDIPGRG